MDCPHIPDLRYGDFSKRLRDRLGGQRVPITGSLELTFRCNLRCVHCYVAHGHSGIAGQRELTAGEISSILDQAVDEGCLWLLLTGGEPLLRPDFQEIYLSCKKKGLILTLFTNGTLLTPQIADLLAEWRPFAVEVTLYGRTQETYERITGIPGSHARCLRGIDLLLERGIPLRLKTMLMTLNKHEVWDIKAFAEGLGVQYRFDPMMNGGLQDLAPLAYRLSPGEVVALDLADESRSREWRTFCDRFRGVRADPHRLFICGAGHSSFHVDPYGQLSPCLIARHLEFDLRQGSFHAGWHQFLAQVRALEPGPGYACAQCELLPLCGQCPGWAMLEGGNREKPVEFLCQIAHLRANAFGWYRDAENTPGATERIPISQADPLQSAVEENQ